MKKTFKKQFILLAVIAVMMAFAFVIPASAEDTVLPSCPGMSPGGHYESNLEIVVYPPTCQTEGYTVEECKFCKVVTKFFDETSILPPTGHNYAVSYEKADGENSYTRVRKCQNELCGTVPTTLDGTPVSDEKEIREGGYYLVEYVNEYESPDVNAADHASYYLEEFYRTEFPSTWVLKSDKKEDYCVKFYESGTKATDSGTETEPKYEYINETDGLKLYAKSVGDVPERKGDNPVRNKDKNCGEYTFTGWVTDGETAEGKITYTAAFEPVASEKIHLNYAFYNSDGSMLSSVFEAHYGELVSRDKGPETPTKASNAAYRYEFVGWTVGKAQIISSESDNITYYTDKIPVYFDVNIYACFRQVANKYQVELVDYKGNAFEEVSVVNDVTVGGNALSEAIDKISDENLKVPNDAEFYYNRDSSAWLIKSVNGESVSGEKEVNPYKFKLADKIYVTDKNSGELKEIRLGDGDTLVLTPKYNKSLVYYNFKVNIKPARFLEEDVWEDNSVLKSDILGKFIIQVIDQNGQYIATGTTDENGDFYFRCPYRSQLTIKASMQNQKYAGSSTVTLAGSTFEEIQRLEKNGIVILPEVTQEWLDGLRSCGCICHSILSPLVIRIYNILYNIFKIRYACCDDLFIVHGNVLAYTPQ